MSTLQVKNVPEDLHARLRDRAAQERCTLSDLILRSLERELSRGDWLSRLHGQVPVDLGVRATNLVEAERRDHEQT